MNMGCEGEKEEKYQDMTISVSDGVKLLGGKDQFRLKPPLVSCT